MAFIVPPAKNYTSPLNAVPLDWIGPPVEGNKGIQCSITWSVAESGANKSVFLNMQNNATLNFSKIRAIVVDNSRNGSDVQVIFPDTETTMTIPSYTPYAVIPVFTNQTQFYMLSPNALATDKTSFMILNTLPPPIAVPTTEAQNFIANGGIVTTVAGSTQLVPATVNGTLESVDITTSVLTHVAVNFTEWSLVDGTGVVFAARHFSTNTDVIDNSQPYAHDDLRLRFSQGLSLVYNNLGTASSFASVNLYYRLP